MRLAGIVILALCMTGCKDKDDASKTKTGGALDTTCQHLAAACGDQGKHVDKIALECKQAAAKLVEKGCTDKASAVYACYEKELCGKTDKVWAVDDLRVLAERQNKCAA